MEEDADTALCCVVVFIQCLLAPKSFFVGQVEGGCRKGKGKEVED